MESLKCGERGGQLLFVLLGLIFFFSGVFLLLIVTDISLHNGSSPYWFIIGCIFVVAGNSVLLVTLGVCCQPYAPDEESGSPYGQLEEEIKTEGLSPGIYSPYHPNMNQVTSDHWVDIPLGGHQEKNIISANSHNTSYSNHHNSETHVNSINNSTIDIKNDPISSLLASNQIYNKPSPVWIKCYL